MPHAQPMTPPHGRGGDQRPTKGQAQDGPSTGPHKIAGGSINVPTFELACVWGLLQDGHIRALELRTWLAAREVAERRKFAPRGSQPRFQASELVALVGGGEEAQVLSSLRRLERLGVLRWSPTAGPSFVRSPEDLVVDDLSTVLAIQRQMPDKRRSFPLPRRILRLVAGGVKRSVAAAIFGHLVRCPHYTAPDGWSGVGSCKASWVAETFGLSLRAAKEARAHLVGELGWLRGVEAPQWHQNRHGGRFEVDLAWSQPRPATEDQGLVPVERSGASCPEDSGLAQAVAPVLDAPQPVDNSTGPAPTPSGGFAPPLAGKCPGFAPPESKQSSPKEIQTSSLGGEPPQPPVDPWNKGSGGGAASTLAPPKLSKLVREDLRSVPRVMELFDQALKSPVWREKGWTPAADTHLERLNWASAARRALVRGGPNPCGLFVHLVSSRKWEHVSNDDEEAVRREVTRCLYPEADAGEQASGSGARGGEGRAPAPALTPDARVLRNIEAVMRRERVMCEPEELERQLELKGGWPPERTRAARAALQAWKLGGSPAAGTFGGGLA